MEPITYFNRETQKLETEEVYGEGFLKWAYGNPLGKTALHTFVKRPGFSKWYGKRMSTPDSRSRVAPFIEKYRLEESDFEKKADEFTSFNDFFYRTLAPGARPIDPAPESIVFPADGRHFGFTNAEDVAGVFIKGQKWSLEKLVGDPALAEKFKGGSLVLSRLCPVDYHRYHFPVAGTPGETQNIRGPLFSVSPIALRQKLSYLWENKRTVTVLETEKIGTVICMEIGATCVGTIHQTFQPGSPVEKGAEKGYFAFGGSSTITLFEPGKVQLEADLLEHSGKHIELYSKMGTKMATIA